MHDVRTLAMFTRRWYVLRMNANTRDIRFTVLLCERERDDLERMAQQVGLTSSAFVRLRLFGRPEDIFQRNSASTLRTADSTAA